MNSQAANNTTLPPYRVLDLSDEKGWPCSRVLADMGGDVVMVEPPEGRDGAPVNRRSPAFTYLNGGKRSLSLDLNQGPGQEVFRRLVRTADVVVESGPPGYLSALGLGYPELSQISPRLIVASITGFGQDGPYRDYKVSDIAASALGGWMSVCGEADMPLKPSGNQAYHSAGLFAATGILLALWHRHATGRGQHLDISIMECVAATLDHVLVGYFYQGVVARRQGSRYWNNAFRIFPCRDGHILLSLFQQWETLVEWLNSEGMAGDLASEKWRDRDYQLRHVDHIVTVLARWTRRHNVNELVETGQLMRFPWAAVTSVPGLVASPQLAGRNFFIARERPDGRRYRYPGPPAKLSGSPWRSGGAVPAKGEHNAEIYRQLGLSAAAIAALAEKRVI